MLPHNMQVPNIPLVPLDQPAATVLVLSHREYNYFQLFIIMGDDHRWLAGIDLGHDPGNELFEHWIASGAAKRFADHYKVALCPDNFARNFGIPTVSFGPP